MEKRKGGKAKGGDMGTRYMLENEGVGSMLVWSAI